jgi:hypothetical protein
MALLPGSRAFGSRIMRLELPRVLGVSRVIAWLRLPRASDSHPTRARLPVGTVDMTRSPPRRTFGHPHLAPRRPVIHNFELAGASIHPTTAP